MKRILKIALMCFVFTFAIFGVACGQENSVGNNDTGNSAEVPVVPEENIPPENDTEQEKPSEDKTEEESNEEEDKTEEESNEEEDKTQDEPSDNQTPTEEDKPEEPVDPEIQLALEIENYLSKLVEENVSMISMMTNITTTSSHDNDTFSYTISFASSEEYELYSMMIDKTLFQSNFEKANLILSIDYTSPNVTLTYTKAEVIYPQIIEYLSELIYTKTEELKTIVEMMSMTECKISITYRQSEKDFVYTISFDTDLDFESAMMFFDPTAYQPVFDKCELSLTTSQSSPNLILTYSIV